MALTPVLAEKNKRNRPRSDRGPGSVRLKMMGPRTAKVAEPQVSTRGGNMTLYVAPPPTGSNLGDGSAGAPYETIQFAFLRAISGDQIRVMPGTYNECINNLAVAFDPDGPGPMIGVQKNLDIVADDWIVNGIRTSTIIDGTGICTFPFSVVNLAGSGTFGSIFEGFTVTGGIASGVFVLGSGVVTNNIVTGNTSLDGGGIYAFAGTCYYGDSQIVVSNNEITNNTANDVGECDVGAEPCNSDLDCGTNESCLFFGGDGGGLYVRADAVNSVGGCAGGNTDITVDNNVIDQNGADSAFGGGLYTLTNTETGRFSSVAITQNLISNNSTLPFSIGYGGGAWIGTFGYGNEQIDFIGNTVSSNFSTGDGGGVSAWVDALGVGVHTINLTGNDVQLNSAEGAGGGIDLFVIAKDIIQLADGVQLNAGGNLVAGNEAEGTGTTFFPGVGGGISSLIWAQRSNSTVELNLFENEVRFNTASLGGGGMSVLSIADSDPDMDGMRFLARTQAAVHNNLVAQNTATDGVDANSAVGGGILAYAEGIGGIDAVTPVQSEIRLTFNTVAQNTSDVGSGGIEVESHTAADSETHEGSSLIEIEHSIIYDNSGYGVGGPMPLAAGVILPTSANPNTGDFEINFKRNSMFMNETGDFEGWITSEVDTETTLFTDPLLNASFRPSQCSDTVDHGDMLISAALEPSPNGGLVNLGHTGNSDLAVTTLADASNPPDGIVDGVDLLRLSVAFGSDPVSSRWNMFVDFDRDNFISGIDLALLAADFARSCP